MSLLAGKTDPVNSIPKYNSNTEVWINWHKSLKDNFGKKIANQLWLKAWSIRGNSSANTSDLRKYMSSNGINISESSWDKVVDLGVGITDSIGTAFQVTKYAGIALGVIFIGGLAMIIYNIAKNPASSAGIAAKSFVKA